ncbi:unnamed protein product [Amoebophrya sp. A120]|nr:unnamed protein product [Amoebophrya sp. A120]|eukprot:GSA120T00019557001.1
MAPQPFLDLPTVLLGDGQLRDVGNFHEKSFYRIWTKDHKLQHLLQQTKMAYSQLMELLPTDGVSLGKQHLVASPSETAGQKVRMFETGMLLNLLSTAEEIWKQDTNTCNMLQERAQVQLNLILEEQNLYTLKQEERKLFQLVANLMGRHVWHPEEYWDMACYPDVKSVERYWMGARMLFDTTVNPYADLSYARGAEKNLDVTDSNFHAAWERINQGSANQRDNVLGNVSEHRTEAEDAQQLMSEALSPFQARPSTHYSHSGNKFGRKLNPMLDLYDRHYAMHLRQHKIEGRRTDGTSDDHQQHPQGAAGLGDDRAMGDEKLRSKFGHKQCPPDAQDLEFFRICRRETERTTAQLLSEADLLKKEITTREVKFTTRRAQLVHKIYDTNAKFQLLSAAEADQLKYELSLLRKRRKLLNLMNACLDEIREGRIDFFARIELVDKEAELHIAVDEQLLAKHGKHKPAELAARVACHQALSNAFKFDPEDDPNYADNAVKKAMQWDYNAADFLFDETARKLKDLQGVNVLELAGTPVPEKQDMIHAELELLNLAMIELERDTPDGLLDDRLKFLVDIIRTKIKRLRIVAIQSAYNLFEVENAKKSLRAAFRQNNIVA